jgi:hypothetical protein
VRRYELWANEDGHSFFPDDAEGVDRLRRDAQSEGKVLAWQTTAKGLNPAMRALYEHLGYGEYQPQLRSDGTPYPEDEDDDYESEPTQS